MRPISRCCRSTRQQYHQRIAQVLAEQFPETARRSPNCWRITTPRRAWQRRPCPTGSGPAQRATGRSAHVEAIGHLTKGLEVLSALPDTPERAQHELDVADSPWARR